jgi:hypothetical protein
VDIDEPAVDAAGIAKPARIYGLRSTFASNALAAGITVYEPARIMCTSVSMIEPTTGRCSTRRTTRCSNGSKAPASASACPTRAAAAAAEQMPETAWNGERTTGLEPATYGLGSRRSTS